jgi:hypothetical protein
VGGGRGIMAFFMIMMVEEYISDDTQTGFATCYWGPLTSPRRASRFKLSSEKTEQDEIRQKAGFR